MPNSVFREPSLPGKIHAIASALDGALKRDDLCQVIRLTEVLSGLGTADAESSGWLEGALRAQAAKVKSLP